jgi:nucleotide-binding universal stress UspA family protein
MAVHKIDFMGKFKSILLCTDGSDYSSGAIHAAIDIARECGRPRLTVFRALEFNPEFETEGLKFAEKIELQAREHLEMIREAAAENDVECEAVVRRTTEPWKAIIEEAKKRNSDMIVMGRRGMTGLKKILIGSQTSKVIAYAPCSILVVPKDAVMRGKTLLLATDGSKYSEAAEMTALNMCSRCTEEGVCIVKNFLVLSVARTNVLLERARSNVEKIKKDAEERGIKVEPIVQVGRPYEVILKTAEERDVDLIVMGTHGRTGLERVLMGSVTERIVALSRCAVLVVKYNR